MTTMLAVLPVVWDQTAGRCLGSIFQSDSSLGLDPMEILVVDNTRGGLRTGLLSGDENWPTFWQYRDPDGHNLGVAGSWNIGARRVLEQGLDYLVILSASMIFGYRLHTTFRAEIEAHDGAPLIEAMGHSWHAIAIHRRTFEDVGLFDENFWPGYYEATEFGWRLRLRGYEDRPWPRVWFNAMSAGQAIHVDRSRWDAPLVNDQALRDYYIARCGAYSPDETFTHPFDDPSKALGWWERPSIPEMAERFGLGERGEGWW